MELGPEVVEKWGDLRIGERGPLGRDVQRQKEDLVEPKVPRVTFVRKRTRESRQRVRVNRHECPV